jgi:hypothetical protein
MHDLLSKSSFKSAREELSVGSISFHAEYPAFSVSASFSPDTAEDIECELTARAGSQSEAFYPHVFK